MTDIPKGILVSGHRGERVGGAENTMAAFRKVVSEGVDMVETDVRMTRDRQLILMHDERVDRTTDGSGMVAQMTFEEIRRLNAAVLSGGKTPHEPPASLAELLDFALEHPGLQLIIEFKDYPTAGNEAFAYECCDRTCDMLKQYGVQGRTQLCSFDGRILEHAYRKHGKSFMYQGFYPWFILGKMEIDPESFIDVACMQHRYQAEDGTVHKYEEPLCPKEWFEYLIGRGITPLSAPSLKEYDKYDLTFSWGSRIVNHDHPGEMLEHLRKKGLHP